MFGSAPYSFAFPRWVPRVGCVKRALVPCMARLAIALVVAPARPPAQAAPFAYIPNFGDSTVSVIDTASDTVVSAPIPVGAGPLGVAVNPAGTRVFVTNLNANSVSVIDTATNTVVRHRGRGNRRSPYWRGRQRRGHARLCGELRRHTVSVIDTATNTVGAAIPWALNLLASP